MSVAPWAVSEPQRLPAWCPERRELPRVYDWVVYAEQRYMPSGEVLWDVRARHISGAELFPGPNLHRDAAREMERLRVVVA